MGQAPGVVENHFRCLLDTTVPCRPSCGSKPSNAPYTTQSSESNTARTKAVRFKAALEELGDDPCTCHLPLTVSQGTIINPIMDNRIDTNFGDLVDMDGDGVSWNEVWDAVSMSMQVQDMDEQMTSILTMWRIRGVSPQALEIPLEFTCLGFDWSSPPSTVAILSESRQEYIEECLKSFLASMHRGVPVQLQIEELEGEDREAGTLDAPKRIGAVLSVDREVRRLLITVGALERSVELRFIRWVRPQQLNDNPQLPSNERESVVQIRLAGHRILRVCFDSEDQAAYFGTCMHFLARSAYASAGSDTLEA